mmetsp:Transcript_474/g.1041  ORF Transcript_474/g.1041 Transcript_474/m.1041 type:complete len:355 (+) Transcript_474:368-1432(+)
MAFLMRAGSSRTRSPLASLRVSPHMIRAAFSLSSSVPVLSSWSRSRFFSASARSRSKLFFLPPDLARDLLSKYAAFLDRPAIPPKSTPAKSASLELLLTSRPVLTTVPPKAAASDGTNLLVGASFLPTRVDPLPPRPSAPRFLAASILRFFSARRAALLLTESGVAFIAPPVPCECAAAAAAPVGRRPCFSAILARSLARRASMRDDDPAAAAGASSGGEDVLSTAFSADRSGVLAIASSSLSSAHAPALFSFFLLLPFVATALSMRLFLPARSAASLLASLPLSLLLSVMSSSASASSRASRALACLVVSASSGWNFLSLAALFRALRASLLSLCWPFLYRVLYISSPVLPLM